MAIKEIKSKINDNKQEKERKLLNTALHLFSEKGIKKTSIQDIVKDAGIAKGTFYLYFKDKNELQDVLLHLMNYFPKHVRKLLNNNLIV